MDVRTIFLKIPTPDIAYLKFLIESYEGVGIVRTVDQRQAIVVLLIAEDHMDTVRSILASVRQESPIVEVPRPRGVGDDWLFKEITEEEDSR